MYCVIFHLDRVTQKNLRMHNRRLQTVKHFRVKKTSKLLECVSNTRPSCQEPSLQTTRPAKHNIKLNKKNHPNIKLGIHHQS